MTCYLCSSSDVEKIGGQLRGALENRFQMRPHRCNGCGLVFLFPLMSEEEEQAFYRDEYRRIYHGGGYDLESFHQARSPDSKARRIRLSEERLLHGAILDVGSSTGNFLETVQDDVETCCGIELDERQREFAQSRGLTMFTSINEIGERKFDLITVFHVLEHIRDPIAFLAALAQALKPDGSLVVEVPNVDDVLLSRYGIPEFASFYWHPAHSYYFSKDTLARVAEAAALQAIVSGLQRYPLENHLGWLRDRKPGSALVCDFLSDDTRQSYERDLCQSFLCDTLWMIAKR